MSFLAKMGWRAPALLDGALGTMLFQGGLEPGKSTITMNLERPELVLEVHQRYIEAGSQAISANTFGGNIRALESAGLESRERDYNIAGMRLCREAAAGGRVKVAGDMGPTGDFHREFDERRIAGIYIRQAELMMECPPDFFLIETMFDVREALTALKAVKMIAGDIPVAVSMTFNRTRRGFFTVMGDPAADSFKKLEAEGADAVGSNCTLTPEGMLELYWNFRSAVEVPVIIQPNAGQPELIEGDVVYRMEAAEFAEGLFLLAQEGAEIVGGCCGSTPEMISLARERLSKLRHHE